MDTENKYPIGGYAPGNYHCSCYSCGNKFIGDKRAVQCEPCALKDKEAWDKLSPKEQDDLIGKNVQAINDFLKKRREIKVTITLRLINEYPIPQNKFPCFCIPTNVGYPDNSNVPKYKWEHAGMVDSIVRTSADYFEIVETNPL